MTKKQLKYDTLYMDFALRASKMSHAQRLKVGAVIVKDDNILSYGFNGAPSGFVNDCEDDEGSTLPHILHAELNAICKAAKTSGGTNGATLYVTHSPCLHCSKIIVQAGISRVVYLNEYREEDGKLLLDLTGVEVVQLEVNDTI